MIYNFSTYCVCNSSLIDERQTVSKSKQDVNINLGKKKDALWIPLKRF